MKATEKGPWIRPLDTLIALLVAAASGWAFVAFQSAPGSHVSIFLDNDKYGWYDLNEEPKEIEIPTRIGKVRVALGGGLVQVLDSPCSGKRCVHTGAIKRTYGEITCAPARLFIAIEGDDDSGEGRKFDAISF